VNSQQAFEWQFGGWAGFPPWLGWTLLIFIAAGGVGLAVWLYHDTLQTLAPRQRAIFILLRSGFFLGLLVCLAGPARVERTYDSGTDGRPLAVVVDRSASMTAPDAAGLSRLTAAIHTWKESEAAAIHSFPALRYFSFSNDLTPASDLDQAVNHADPGTSTALFDSLDHALQSAPGGGYGGIVCLTDGLDTTQATSEKLISRAVQSHTPLFFVAGENRQNAQENLIVRETVVPGQVLRKSQFNATALVEAHCAKARDVPLALWQDDHELAATTIHLTPGANLFPWSISVQSDEPAMLHLHWQLGDGADQETIAATVRVVAQNQVAVLFYQGTLDWGFRFVNSALQRDASFTVTGLFNPDLNIAQVATTNSQSTLTALPDSADALQTYQIIVLANTFADQLSDAQQKALSDYVRKGGGLLFLVSDTKIAQTFSRSSLEAMLPVVFDPAAADSAEDPSMEQFQSLMHNVGGANVGNETDFAANAMSGSGLDPLKSFALPANTTRAEIAKLFGNAPGEPQTDLPKFASYAHVASLKAGADVLAVHPTDQTGAKQARALLVTQRFGDGQVTALLTDALWRWKLSLPSTSHAPETFWQQLFLALAGPGGAMHFSSQPGFASLGEQSLFRLDGAPGLTAPTVNAIAPNAATKILPLQPGTHPGEWTFQFSPDQPGKWRLHAQDNRGAEIETLLRVSNVSHGVELSGLPPDVEGLRKLAQATGGALLNDGTPETWASHASTPEATMVSQHARPLWNTWAVLLLALSCYAIELIWRRRAKLL
jgi:uncharacterized membrane protein